ncbi:hypothetical protein Q8A67_005348 [Cirrhinus molitorella]|uniref:Pyrin domain-containing protein n=1 Tax=Cirrhinus molitorella TaxID=172907 RepID=A0AA88TUL1_9TELE|nr:hypothetical protein Q8A67_005348 [Cirrhinus molitorella]
MSTVQELLLKALDDLDSKKLNRFIWLLRTNYASISTSDTENAEATRTVDIMVARFTPEGAVKVMLDILRKMNENHLAEQLENEYKDGNAVRMSRDAHNVDLNLQLGEAVNAPVLTRNIISNPVSANFSSSSGAQYYSRTQKKVDPLVKFPSAGLTSQRRNGRDLQITQYACYLTLDPNTAHPNLFLSERNRKATHKIEFK